MLTETAIQKLHDITQYEKTEPNAALFINSKQMNINLEELASESEMMLMLYLRMFSGNSNEMLAKAWNKHWAAFEILKQKNIALNHDIRNPLISEQINRITTALNNENCIPLENLKKCIFNNAIDFDLFYREVMDEYDVDMADLFGMYSEKNKDATQQWIMSYMDITKDEYNELVLSVQDTSSESINEELFTLLSFIYQDTQQLPYANFWHHLFNHDWKNAPRHSICNMVKTPQYDKHGYAYPAYILQNINELYAKLREFVIREASRIEMVDSDGAVACYLDW